MPLNFHPCFPNLDRKQGNVESPIHDMATRQHSTAVVPKLFSTSRQLAAALTYWRLASATQYNTLGEGGRREGAMRQWKAEGEQQQQNEWRRKEVVCAARGGGWATGLAGCGQQEMDLREEGNKMIKMEIWWCGRQADRQAEGGWHRKRKSTLSI